MKATESVRISVELPIKTAAELQASADRHDRTPEQEARRILRTMLQPVSEPR
jgi:plasmid stability protein